MKRREEGQDLSRARERVSEQLQKEKRASERANSRSLRFWQTHSPPLFSLSHPPSTGRLHAREYHCLLALPQSLLIIMLYTDGERSEGGSREGKEKEKGAGEAERETRVRFPVSSPSFLPLSSVDTRSASCVCVFLSLHFFHIHTFLYTEPRVCPTSLYSYSFAHSRISPLFPLSHPDTLAPGSRSLSFLHSFAAVVV